MIVLDTNVVSEGAKPLPSEIVLSWLDAQIPSAVFTTTITLAEVLYGVEALPAGKRRSSLLATVEKLFAQQFAGRIPMPLTLPSPTIGITWWGGRPRGCPLGPPAPWPAPQ